MKRLLRVLATMLVSLPAIARSAPQEVPYGFGTWDADSLGNHRAVLQVRISSEAVLVHIPWRRRDRNPELKRLILVDARTSSRISNIAPLRIDREFGDLIFEPVSGPGTYYLYYLPTTGSKRSNYPRITYPKPETTAAEAWLTRNGISSPLDPKWGLPTAPGAEVVEFQAIDSLNSFWPMEVIATRLEVKRLLASYPDAQYLVFPEDRTHAIRMKEDLPLRWIKAGPGRLLKGRADRGEFYAFQIGLFAAREELRGVTVTFNSLRSSQGTSLILPPAFRCFNTGGVDHAGRTFARAVTVDSGTVQAFWCGVQIPATAASGIYTGEIRVAPAGLEPTVVPLELEVSSHVIPSAGDDEPWRLSRLRWLDSRLGSDDEVVPPYQPVQVRGNSFRILGRTIEIAPDGFPRSMKSYFAPEMTHLNSSGRELLRSPVVLVVERADGTTIPLKPGGVSFTKRAAGTVAWQADNGARDVAANVLGELDFDGTIEYTVAVRAREELPLGDIRLILRLDRNVAKYMLGLGRKGGVRPSRLLWNWDVTKNQDGAWLGDVNAGMQFTLKDEKYSRPLNTNFYTLKPLVMPSSWWNGGKGGIRIEERSAEVTVTCTSGPRTMRAGETLFFNFRIVVTPFRPIDTRAQWATRYYHRYRPVDEIAATGANTINVHHATAINPYINYPFFRPDAMKAYCDSAHARDMKVKIYYTVRELANRAPELFALRSLGDEIFAHGAGGGYSWLQEHLVDDYIAAWFVPELKDAAIVNSGVSRWHNYYVEGVNWLITNVGIDGLYIDDVAFDRLTMQRVRKILLRKNPGALIDLHSANQFNPRDGYANSANLYLEHFPYIDRLWFGEYFDYDAPPDYWLTEVSGIPFGLMGEMLEKGGNPWRGMIFGMTNRLPWAGDPRPIWKVWDDFHIQESRMIGYWVANSPVKTGRDSILATVYTRRGAALISIASWAKERQDVRLKIDWKQLGINRSQATLVAPAVGNFQPESRFNPDAPIPVEPGKGWLIIIDTAH
jgi:Glycoside hydrolase 123, N-terminal domain